MNQNSFQEMGISERILSVLTRLKFTDPTPIQSQAIPVGISGKDIIGIAQTGTGKTLAFALPTIQRVAALKKQALVILPTRELALQVEETFRRVGSSLGLRTAILIGGTAYNRQIHALRSHPHVVIATPGRLLDHLESKNFRCDQVGILILDEADQMLDMGFAPQINKILKAVPHARQTMLFSATMPQAIVNIATQHMKLPVRIEVAPQGSTTAQVVHELFIVKRDAKIPLLKKLLREYQGKVLVFSRTKHGAKKIHRDLQMSGVSSDELHSNKSLNQRTRTLARFKDGSCRVLIATDIAARGIDVRDIELVVNFDLPDDPNAYVHRIGRTGRAGKTGRALSFATPDQARDVRDIERVIRNKIPRIAHSDFPKEEFIEGAVSPKQRQRGRRNFKPRNKSRHRSVQKW